MKKMTLNEILLTLSISMVVACTDNDPPSPDKNTQNVIPSAVQSSDNAKSNHVNIESETLQVESHTPTIRSADSHTHGDAELAIVLEGDVVTVELDTPLYNLVGFEHAPETEAHKTIANHAESRLGQGGELFTFNARANCKIKTNRQDLHLFEHDSDHEDEHDPHDDHEESDDTHEHSDDKETHKDVRLQYEFHCKQPSSLISMSVNLFEFFAELSEVDATYLGPSIQRQVKLTPENTQMDMQP